LIRRALILLGVALVLAGCGNDVVKDYGAEAKANFVGACTTERSIKGTTLTTTPLAQKSTCTCVYNYIASSKHQLAFGDLTDYEAKVSDASDGDLPKPPAKLTTALRVCVPKSGPTPSTTKSSSSSTTTTVAK
jgi:hypothetical protein